MSTRPRLQNRLMLAFAGFSLLVAAVFGLYAVVFMYSVEDSFFDAMLDQEAAVQLRQHAAGGHWAPTRDAWISLHSDPASFPADLQPQFVAEPWRREFPGANARHYHLKKIVPPPPAAGAWLVAEVSAHLVVRPMRNRVLLLLAGSGLLIVTIALLAGYWIARRTTRPLARLAAHVDRMSPDRLPVDLARDFPDDEVGVLAHGLQGLVDRVQAFILREQEFTRDASHELRTPLAVILGAAERLATEPQLSDAGRLHLGHVRQSIAQLERTVTTLLMLAREQPVVERNEPVPILPRLERVIVEQSPLLDGKDVTVEVELGQRAQIALPDPVLHILLSNLVGNAFAHTAAGNVRIDLHNGRLRIANSGDADDPSTRWQAQQPFSKREGSSGFGLGFAILRRLCDRYRIDLQIGHGDGTVVASIALDPGP